MDAGATLQRLWLEHASLGAGSGVALALALRRSFGELQHLWLAGNGLQDATDRQPTYKSRVPACLPACLPASLPPSLST